MAWLRVLLPVALLMSLALGVLVRTAPTDQPASQASVEASDQQVHQVYGKLPLSFEINQGQTAEQVDAPKGRTINIGIRLAGGDA